MKPWMVLLLLVLVGCTRPLTEGETRFANDLFGPGLNSSKVRVALGAGLSEPSDTKPPPEAGEKIKPRAGVCDRVAPNAPQGPPPAWALYNRIHFIDKWYRDDFSAGWPDTILLPQVFIFAHELVHVWQWQNRRKTGYRPALAGLESVVKLDPYFYEARANDAFFSYDYEQQASLLEDYLCYAIFDKANPRRKDLRKILAPHFQMDRIDQRF